MRALGIKPGERVGVLAPNSWQYAVAYFGIAKASAVSV